MSINDWRRKTDPPERCRKIRIPRSDGFRYICGRCGKAYTMVRRHSDMEPLRYAHDCTCGGRFIFQSKCSIKKRRSQ